MINNHHTLKFHLDGTQSFPFYYILFVSLIIHFHSFATANVFSHGRCMTSLQTVLNPQSSLSSPLSSVLCKTSADALLKVQGGSTSVRYIPRTPLDGDESPVIDDGNHGVVLQKDSSNVRQHTQLSSPQAIIPSSAATTRTGLSTRQNRQEIESFPLRLSTSQMGSSIMIDYVFQDMSLGRKRRNRWRQKLSRRNTERHGHKHYAKKLKNRNSLNIGRKTLHASFGFFFATLNQLIPKNIFVPAMSILTFSTLLMECLRYRKGFEWMNDTLNFMLGGTLRKHEMEGKFTGSFYYFLGVTITAACFPQSCASLGICQLAVADPAASFFGRMTRNVYWSRIQNGFFGIGRNKGFLGFLGGALACLPMNYRILSLATMHTGHIGVTSPASIAMASVLLGLAGSFADLCVPTPALTMPKEVCGVPMLPFHVDDNVVVPIFSGFMCTKIFEYLQWIEPVTLTKFLAF
mmetsp:Transcript_9656/g.18126  ORF Transcript_9656/g.18126 Transcript_9656/m.18126 type:complete len:462 (+) Transcript_9656:111-1496(+)